MRLKIRVWIYPQTNGLVLQDTAQTSPSQAKVKSVWKGGENETAVSARVVPAVWSVV